MPPALPVPTPRSNVASFGPTGRVLIKGALLRYEDNFVVDTFVFQYNPTEIRRSCKTGWVYSDSPGQFRPAVQFGSFQDATINFTLFLFGREGARDVEKQLSALELFCVPGNKFSLNKPQFISPGRAELSLGGRCWSGVVESIDASETMYNRDLKCLMATVDVQFRLVSFGIEDEVAYVTDLRDRAGVTI